MGLDIKPYLIQILVNTFTYVVILKSGKDIYCAKISDDFDRGKFCPI